MGKARIGGSCPLCGHDMMLLNDDGVCLNRTRCDQRLQRRKQNEKFWLIRAHGILQANGDYIAATEVDRVLHRKYMGKK